MTLGTAATAKFKLLRPGDPAPWFRLRTPTQHSQALDTMAGRYIVLAFFGSAAGELGAASLQSVMAGRRVFDDRHAAFFGVSIDPADEYRLKDAAPGIRFYFDFELEVSKRYGVVPPDVKAGDESVPVRRLWFVLDPMLRIMRIWHQEAGATTAAEVLDYVASLPPPAGFAGFETPAPILILPRVFEPEFCERLVELHSADGGTPSGFMVEEGGKTVIKQELAFKSRRDLTITDEQLRRDCQSRVARTIAPEIKKIHHFEATRIERYLVACYDAAERGHFEPHRDNSTKGTAHRRFAVSINLNADFEGGAIQFPEYGPRGYKPPVGGAAVFSCSMLHAVSPVTHGRRYAFLPFLYDEGAALFRKRNNEHLGDGVPRYVGSE